MPLSLTRFVELLENSGVISTEALRDHIPPNRHPKDARDLAYELVRRKKLTRYQAETISRGNAKSLILGNYLLLKRIGTGAYGQVFKARHRRLDRIVAVKVLHKDVMKTDRKVARFEREARATAKVNHPNIVTVYDADSARGVHFLVMEYVKGADLGTLIAKKKRFSVKQAINFVLQSARGLEAAHAAGIIHRDIKPANLLLNKQGLIKVLDLGLALYHEDVHGQAELTQEGTSVGTVNYMAPEQALSSKSADARADVYSLGCSLYSILTGEVMYEGDTLVQILLAHRDMPIPSLRSVRPDVPEQVEAIYLKMVAKQPDDRYATMTELIADLKRCTSPDEKAIDTRLLLDESQDGELASFLSEISESPAVSGGSKSFAPAMIDRLSKGQSTSEGTNFGRVLFSKWREATRDQRLLMLGAGAICLVLMVAGVFWSLAPAKGTRGVKVNEPGAMVQSESKSLPDASEAASRNASDTLDSPEFRQWMKTVVEMAPDAQVSAVVKKLQELNPGFDGQVTHRIENAVVVELAFVTDRIANVAPVRALLQLKNLRCHGDARRRGRLADLSPLEGMHLTTLDVRQSAVADLRPLIGMPLTNLTCDATQVSDLTPLKGLPLTHLNIGNTLVTDLTPLKQLPLAHLSCCVTQVSSLEPLKGMPLKSLDCRNTPVTDFSPLRECPLTTLWCDIQTERDAPVLRALTALVKLNDKPIAEFRQESSGKSPANPP